MELTILTNLFTIGDGLSTQKGHPFGLFKELIGSKLFKVYH
jgi:hypothetical protein